MAACRTCENPQVDRINALLAAGGSVRGVARMFTIPRSSLARHAQHVEPNDRRLGIVPQAPPEDPRVDPLEEAQALLKAAVTERERLKALEQVRAAVALRLREMDEPDEEVLELLDESLSLAELAYRSGSRTGSFERSIRGLQGVREAIRQRIDVVRGSEMIDVRFSVTHPDGTLDYESGTYPTPVVRYFAGVPSRFHDHGRYRVDRTIHLAFPPNEATQTLRVYEIASGGLVWTKDPT